MSIVTSGINIGKNLLNSRTHPSPSSDWDSAWDEAVPPRTEGAGCHDPKPGVMTGARERELLYPEPVASLKIKTLNKANA